MIDTLEPTQYLKVLEVRRVEILLLVLRMEEPNNGLNLLKNTHLPSTLTDRVYS